jgi:hypothetical protein
MFSKYCLLPALAYLSAELTDSAAAETVHKCVQDAIFSTENLVDYINSIEAPNAQGNPDTGFDMVLNAMLSFENQQALFDGEITPLHS